MPEHLRAFVVVAVLGFGSLWALSGPLGAIFGQQQVGRWRQAWLLVSAAAFLSGNFWLYAVLLAGVVVWLRPSPMEAAALFLVLFGAAPASGATVPGFGVVNYLFELNHVRLLTLLLLLPAAFKLSGSAAQPARFSTDRWMFAYLLLTCLLQFRQSTFTDSLRACFLIGLDVFLPYYVFSRAVTGSDDVRRLMGAYVLGAAVMGALGVFEMVRAWNLYSAVVRALDTSWGFLGYLLRDGMQRASVTAGQAIAFGYVMVVGLGLWMSLHARGAHIPRIWIPGTLLVGGLIASLSRGPWMGGGIVYLAFMLMGPGGLRKIGAKALLSIALIPLAMMTPWGERVAGLLPFVGNVDVENVDYRSRLIDNSLIVIMKNPLFGSAFYLSEPEMLQMMQGEGIIDVVNTYLWVALNYGVVGLFLFVMVFFSAVLAARQVLSRVRTETGAGDDVGRGLVSVLVSIMVMIFTVSSISVIGLVYWCVLGMASGYAARRSPVRRSAVLASEPTKK